MIFSSLVRCQPMMQCLRFSRFSRGFRFAKARHPSDRQAVSFSLRTLSGVAFTAGLAHKTLKISSAQCREMEKESTENIQAEHYGSSSWSTFMYLLRKEWVNLLIALATALAVAVCQAMMPVYLEDVISTLRNVLWSSPFAAHNVHPIVFRLIALCIAQSISSVFYIVTLVKISRNSSERQHEDDAQSTSQDVSEQ